MPERDSFEQLVSDLSPEERREMLEKMQGYVGNPDEESLVPEPAEEVSISFDAQLKNESLFLRLWLWLKSLFSNTSVEALFNEHRISTIFRAVERRSPNLVDLRHKQLLSFFYTKLTELKKCADFFKPYCTVVDGRIESFYVILGSLAMPQVASQMSSEVDPYSIPVAQGARPEMRVTLLRHMDDVMANIPSEQKSIMYNCAKALDWLAHFVRLPFNRLLSQFSSEGGDANYEASFRLVADDMKLFSKVLCNGVLIPNEVLEALYIFKHSIDGRKRNKNTEAASQFIAEAHDHLSMMHLFVSTVPMRAITCIVRGDSYYQPESLSGVEDWFVKFKMGWKTLFDQKWESWLVDCKKEEIRQNLQKHFGLDSFPLLPDRPWADSWTKLHFRYELSAGFLCWYFRSEFSNYELILKTVMTEGDFIKKENRLEFTESFNEYVQVSIGLTTLQQPTEPNGEVGAMIAKLEHEHSIHAVQKCEQLLRSMESDFAHLVIVFGEASRKMKFLMDGILGLTSDSRYDSISNLGTIKGAGNAEFRKNLQGIHTSLQNAFNMLKELEPVDMTPTAR